MRQRWAFIWAMLSYSRWNGGTNALRSSVCTGIRLAASFRRDERAVARTEGRVAGGLARVRAVPLQNRVEGGRNAERRREVQRRADDRAEFRERRVVGAQRRPAAIRARVIEDEEARREAGHVRRD